MMLEIQVLAWDRHKKCGSVRPVNEIPTSPLHKWICNSITYINIRKKKKTCKDSLTIKRLDTITKMNDNIYMVVK